MSKMIFYIATYRLNSFKQLFHLSTSFWLRDPKTMLIRHVANWLLLGITAFQAKQTQPTVLVVILHFFP